jgi:hypothetical protein
MKNLALSTVHTFAGRMDIVKTNSRALGFVIQTKPGVWLAFHSIERPYFVGRFTGKCAKMKAIRRILKIYSL